MDSKKVMWWIVGLVVAIALGVLLWMWIDDDTANNTEDNTNTQEEVIEEDVGASQLEIMLEDPENYLGQSVTIDGEIQDVINNRTFTISDDAVEEELLVVTRTALTEEQADRAEPLLLDNANIQVIGELREFVAADFETDFSVELDQETEAEFENGYILIADSWTFTDSGEIFDFFITNEEERPTEEAE